VLPYLRRPAKPAAGAAGPGVRWRVSVVIGPARSVPPRVPQDHPLCASGRATRAQPSQCKRTNGPTSSTGVSARSSRPGQQSDSAQAHGEVWVGVADRQAAQDRQFRRDGQLRADDLGIPGDRDLNASNEASGSQG